MSNSKINVGKMDMLASVLRSIANEIGYVKDSNVCEKAYWELNKAYLGIFKAVREIEDAAGWEDNQ